MGLFDEAKKLAHNDQGEKITDSLLDKAKQAGEKASGGKFDAQIGQARNEADKRIGNE